MIYNYNNNNNNNFLFYEFYGRVRAVEVYTPDLPRTCTPPYETIPEFPHGLGMPCAVGPEIGSH